MFNSTTELEYRLTITEKESGVKLFNATSPTHDMLLEKYGAWERNNNLACAYCGQSISLDLYLEQGRFCNEDCAQSNEENLQESIATNN